MDAWARIARLTSCLRIYAHDRLPHRNITWLTPPQCRTTHSITQPQHAGAAAVWQPAGRKVIRCYIKWHFTLEVASRADLEMGD